jgi:hypothetical protein
MSETHETQSLQNTQNVYIVGANMSTSLQVECWRVSPS